MPIQRFAKQSSLSYEEEGLDCFVAFALETEGVASRNDDVMRHPEFIRSLSDSVDPANPSPWEND